MDWLVSYYKKFFAVEFVPYSFKVDNSCCHKFMYVSEFNAIYGFFIWSSVYEFALVFLSTMGTGTVSNWYNINGLLCIGLHKNWELYNNISFSINSKCNQFHIII